MSNHVTQQNNAVTLPKQEYLRLKQEAEAYRSLATQVFELPLKDPVGEVVQDFKSSDLYSTDFLEDLEDGLRKSSYTKQNDNQTTKNGS